MNIELIQFESGTENLENRSKGNALLNITITNVTRKYDFPVIINNDKGLIRIVVGRKKISIKDFGLTTPKTLLGMVKVNEQIEINLNFLCKLNLINGNYSAPRKKNQ